MAERFKGLGAGACILASSALLAASGGARAESLADAITLAYQTNPSLQGQRAQLRSTDETYVQARAGYRPTIGISANNTFNWQWLGSGACTTFGGCPLDSTTRSASLSFTQPLYTGGRATAKVHQAEASVLAGRENLRVQEANVMASVIQVYMDVRRDEQALQIRQDNVGVLQRQVDETAARFEVGEVTRTDVAQSQAQLAAAQALLSSAQAQLASDRAAFAAVVGQSPTKLDAEPEFKIFPMTVDQAFDTTQENNPSIRAADYNEQGAEATVAEAKAQRMPSVSFQGDYGYSRSPSVAVNSISPNRSAQAGFVLSQPLFTGGLTSSQIRQAIELDNVAKTQLEAARRTSLQNVSQAWSRLLAARANIAADEEQVRAATVAFEGTRAEQQAGLRTTLEVLTAQQVLENAQLDLINARHDAYIASAAVLQVMGLLEARNLVAGVDQLPGGHSLGQLKHAWGYVPGLEDGVGVVDSIGSRGIDKRPPAVDAPITTNGAAAAAPAASNKRH
jgi:outer membrane protein